MDIDRPITPVGIMYSLLLFKQFSHNTHKTQWQAQLFALGSAGNHESVTQTQRVTLLLTYALSIVEVAILMFVFNSVLFI